MKPQTWTRVPYAVTFALSAALLAGVLYMNHGRFMYALDDPYIHLALSENLRHLHYGVNTSEPSAPASSILWPFLFAPFAGLGVHEYLPFVVNLVAMFATVALFNRFASMLGMFEWKHGPPFAACLVTMLILSLNVIGIAFTGMEHSLQVLCTLAIVLGVIELAERNRAPWWLLITIVVGPLIRYENLAISLAAIAVLALHRRFAAAAASGLLIAVCVGGFSLFLVSLGLHPLPASVVQKGDILEPGTGLGDYIATSLSLAWASITSVQSARVLAVLAVLLIGAAAYRRKQRAAVTVALVAAFAVVAHLFAGRYGWWCRYEAYVLIAATCALLYALRQPLQRAVERVHPIWSAAAVVVVFMLAFNHLFSPTVRPPWGANNIYEQQYQMHRFATEFHKGPVAVNDLGWVAYRNPEYVLDLWGLASAEAGTRRRAGDPEYIADLVDRYKIPLLMIYDRWLGEFVPDNYTRLAELHLSRRAIAVGSDTVAFYATPHGDPTRLADLLVEFQKVLPERVTLDITSP